MQTLYCNALYHSKPHTDAISSEQSEWSVKLKLQYVYQLAKGSNRVAKANHKPYLKAQTLN